MHACMHARKLQLATYVHEESLLLSTTGAVIISFLLSSSDSFCQCVTHLQIQVANGLTAQLLSSSGEE